MKVLAAVAWSDVDVFFFVRGMISKPSDEIYIHIFPGIGYRQLAKGVITERLQRLFVELHRFKSL